MKLSTSTRISLWFTSLVILLTIFLSVLVSGFFYRSWYRSEEADVRRFIVEEERKLAKGKVPPPGLRRKFSPVIRIDKVGGDQTYAGLLGELDDSKVVRFDGSRYLPVEQEEAFFVKDVSGAVARQQSLLRLLALSVVLSGILGFLLSKWGVKQGLKDLFTLHKEIAEQDIDNLEVVGTYDHLPQDDEIAVLATTFRKNSRQLKQQVEDMQQFIAHASHELRTPLMSLRAAQDVAKKTQQYDDLIETNLRSIDHMQELTQGLLTLSQSGIASNDIEKVVVEEYVETITKELHDIYAHKGISLHKQYLHDVTVEVSRYAFTAVVKNIIENAFKYVNEGGSVEVTLDATSLRVSNSGSYISPEDQNHIWKTFWQVDDARTQGSEGFGLGLSLVKRLCDVHGWQVSVTSNETTGTCFILSWMM